MRRVVAICDWEVRMTSRMLAQAIKSPWTYIGLFLTIIALIVGFAYGSAWPAGAVAEQPTPVLHSESGAARTPTTHPTPLIIATPEPGQVIPPIPVTISYEHPETEATGSAPRYQGPSIPGQRKLNLLDGSQVTLPDNVHIVDTVTLGTCSPGPCPPLPGYVLEMDGATVEVDGDGKAYPIDSQTDMDGWRFLTER